MVETEEKEDTLLGFNVKVLSQLGLNEDEAVAYSILVGTGVRTAEEVALYTGQPVNETIAALVSLSEKGYARRISGIVDIYQSLNPQIVISSAAEEQLETELNRTISDINDMWKFGADLLKDTTSKFTTDTKSLSDSKISDLHEIDKNINHKIGQMIQKLKADLKDLTEDKSAEASKNTTNDYNALQDSLQTLKTTVSNDLNEQISVLENSMTELEQKSIELVDGSEKELKAKTDVAMKSITDELSDIRDNNTQLIKNFEDKLLTTAKDLETQIEDQRRNLTDSVRRVGQTTIDSFENNLSQLHAIFSKSVEELISQLNNHIDSSLEKTASGVDSNVMNNATAVEEASIRLNNSHNAMSQAFSNVMTALKQSTQYNESIETALGELQEKNKQVQANLTNLETNLTQRSANHNNNMSQTLSNGLIEGKNQIHDSLGKTKNELRQFVASSTTFLNEASGTYTEDILTKVGSNQDDLLSKLENLAKSKQEQTKTIISDVKSEISTEKGNILQTLDEQIQEARNKVNEQSDLIHTSTKNQLDDVSEKIRNQITTDMEQFQNQYKSRKDQMDSELSQHVDSIKSNEIDVSTKLNNMLDEMTEQINSLRTTTIDDSRKNSLDRAEQLKTYLSKFSMRLNETLNDFSNQTEQESGAIRQEIPPALDRLVTDHKNRIQSFDLSFSESLTQLLEIVDEIHEQLQDKKTRKKLHEIYLPKLEEMKASLVNTQAQLRTLIETHVSTFEGESSRFIDQIERSMTLQIRNIQDLAEQSKEQITNNRNESQTIVGDGYTEVEDIFLNGLQQTVDQNLQTIKTGITQTNNAIHNNANTQTSLIQSIIQTLSTQETGLSASIMKLNTESEEQLISSINELKSNQNSLRVQTRDNLLNIIETMQGQTNSHSDNISRISINSYEAILQQMMELFDSQYTSIRSEFENLRQNISEIKDTSNSALETNLEELTVNQKNDFESILNSAKSSVKDIIDQTEAQILDSGKQIAQTNVEEIISAVKNSTILLDEVTESISQGLSNLLSSFNNETMPAIDTTQNEFTSTLETSVEGMKSTLSESQNIIQTTADSFKESMNELPQMTSQLERAREKMDADLQFNVGNTLSALRNEVLSNENKMHNYISTRTDEAKSTVLQLQKEDLPQTMQTLIDDKLDLAVNTIQDTTGAAHTYIETEITNLRTHNENATAIPFRKIQTNVLDFQKALEDTLSSNDLAINKNFFDFAEKIRETLETYYTQTTTALDSSENDVRTTLTTYVNNNDKTIQDIFTGVIDTVDTIQSDVTKKLSSAIYGIPERVHSALKTTGATMTFLKNVHDFALKTKPLAIEETYPVFGKDAVLKNILGCLTRVKSTINIVIPNLADIPIETLESVPRTRRIEIITAASSISPSILTDIADKASNVVIRQIPEVSVYLAFRDAEEVVLGSGEGDHLAAVISTQEDFVRLLSELQSSFRAQSRQV